MLGVCDGLMLTALSASGGHVIVRPAPLILPLLNGLLVFLIFIIISLVVPRGLYESQRVGQVAYWSRFLPGHLRRRALEQDVGLSPRIICRCLFI